VSRLLEGVQRYGRDWVEVAKLVGRSNYDCLFKVRGEVNAGRMQEPSKGGRGTKSTLWTESETSLLYLAVRQFGRNWPAVSRVVGSRPAGLCLSKYKNEVRSGRMPVPGKAVEPARWTDAQGALLRNALERFGADWRNLEQLLGGVFGEAELRFKAAQLAEQDLQDLSGGGVNDGEAASAAGDGADDDVDDNDDGADGDGKGQEAG
jgi:hypothetical protein